MKIAIIIYLAIGVIALIALTGISTKSNLEKDYYNLKGVKGKIGLIFLVLSTVTSNYGVIVTWPICIATATIGIQLTDD